MLNVEKGSEIPILVGSRNVTLKVVGIFNATNDFSAQVLRQMMIMDISTAQELFSMQGKLSRVDLIQTESYQEIFSGNEFLQGLSQNTKIQSVNESLEAGE